jgi:hypothetical protein
VLLTRSRLCPGPKPGSSLHLHVLGTPPAFVLSQDQTLREELPVGLRRSPPSQRVVRDYNSHQAWPGPRAKPWACPWWDSGPCAKSAEPTYTKGSEAQDGVNLGTAVTPTLGGIAYDGVEPGHTPRPRGRSKGAHAVEFSKTVAPLLGGSSSLGAPSFPLGPGRTDEYSARPRDLERNSPAPSLTAASGDEDRARKKCSWTVAAGAAGRWRPARLDGGGRHS